MIYSRIRDWVDRGWRGGGWRAFVLPPGLLFFAGEICFGRNILVVVPTILLSLAWTVFVFWRWWVYAKELSIDGDRRYDRVGKFKLASEYHRTESVTAARARKKKKNG